MTLANLNKNCELLVVRANFYCLAKGTKFFNLLHGDLILAANCTSSSSHYITNIAKIPFNSMLGHSSSNCLLISTCLTYKLAIPF